MEKIARLREWISQSKSTVFLGGAGVSTASGIPDFRSAHGLYVEQRQGISYEEMLSHSYFVRHTREFYEFLRNVMLYPDARPNRAHYALAELEKRGLLQGIITQNIDGLHQLAGSENVVELHGNESRFLCMKCGKEYGMEAVTETEGVPHCSCGGILKPDVVLYEESLKEEDLSRASRLCQGAELLLVGGTSLVVYPAAGLLRLIPPSCRLVILNRDETPYDSSADLIFRQDLGQVLEAAIDCNGE